MTDRLRILELETKLRDAEQALWRLTHCEKLLGDAVRLLFTPEPPSSDLDALREQFIHYQRDFNLTLTA